MLKVASSGCSHSCYGVFTTGPFHAHEIFSLLDICCANPGNPVFTCDKRTVDKAQLYTFDPKGIIYISVINR